MNTKAHNHYRLNHLRRWGVAPWKRLVLATKEQQQVADQYHHLHMLKGAWLHWNETVTKKSQERDKTADDFFKGLVVRRSWRAWTMYMVWCRELEVWSAQHRKKAIVASIFRAWIRFAKDETACRYEGEKNARLHYHRLLQRSAFRAWHKYIPLCREEKARELRRAELRRKVSAWLPDYQPREFMDSESSVPKVASFDE